MPNASPYTLAQTRIAEGRWRVDPDAGHIYGTRGRPLRRINTWGYVQLKFRDSHDWTIEHAVLAHRVIWEHQHGPLASHLQINHLNGVKTDNRLANLAAVTGSENMQHAFDTGLNRANRAKAILTEHDALTIYRRAWAGERDVPLALEYGISRSAVSNIRRGWSWAHVTHHQPVGR